MSHCSHCGFGNGWDDFYCGGCGRKTSTIAETIPADRAPRTASFKTSSRTTLADLLREEPAEVKEKVAEEKKMMTQEEIDKLFKL